MTRKGGAPLFVFLLFLTAAVPFSAPFAYAQAASGNPRSFAIPMTYDPLTDPTPTVQVRVNGKEALPFVVDTGFNGTLLVYSWAARKLQLSLDGNSGAAATQGAKDVPFREIPVERADILGITDNENLKVRLGSALLVSSEEPVGVRAGPPAAGIIGMGFLSRLGSVEFDFARKRMTLFLDQSPAAALPQGATLPLRSERGLFFVSVSPTSGTSADLMVDTGSNATSVPITSVEKLSEAPAVSSLYETFDGTLYVLDKVLLPELLLGNLREPKVAAQSVSGPGYPRMGVEFLSRFRVTLDFTKNVMRLERASNYALRCHLDAWTGIVLRKKEGQFHVATVAPGSSGERAGVRVGDRLDAIDGKAVSSLPLPIVLNLLHGTADTKASLTLRRSERELSISFERQSEFSSLGYPNLGMTLRREKGSPFVVESVRPGSAAEQAGLRPKDSLLTIGGKSTATLAPEELTDFVLSPVVNLTVERKKGDRKEVLPTRLTRNLEKKSGAAASP